MVVDNGKYYLYRHIRLDKNEPFYIGVGTKNRKANPYYRANYTKNRNEVWAAIYNKTKIEVEILMESNDPIFIRDKEIEFIKSYGRICNGSGTLCNMHEGGYGDKSLRTESVKAELSKRITEYNKRVANERVGTFHFYKGVRYVCVYSLTGEFLYEFESGRQAVRSLGSHIHPDCMLRKIDTSNSYKGYFFCSKKMPKIDVSKFKIWDENKNYLPKKVAQLNNEGGIIKVYNNIKEAAKILGIHKDTLGRNLRCGKKIKAGDFKYYNDVSKLNK